MPKTGTIYVCTNCSAQSPKWSGRCLECGAWGSFREDAEANLRSKTTSDMQKAPAADVIDLSALNTENFQRLPTGITECDRVLGGGIVPGSLILIGGEPGIGKSTLALQIAANVVPPRPAGEGAGGEGVYVSGEESPEQIKSRVERLAIAPDAVRLITETNVEKIIAALLKLKPTLVVIDSIQTMRSLEVDGESGSLNQIRACTVKLLQTAKEHNIAIIITGHITKDGALAGPKTLEHLVDTVLYLEQNKNNDFRILRTVKNRFGSTDEIGLFEMTQVGFREIQNPSGVFLDEMQGASGTAVSCILEGTRPFLVEVQALVTKTVFGYPQRKSAGFDLNRLQILLAVLSKRAGLNLATQDVHVNVVGGLKINETALDLAVCGAIISSLSNQIIAKDTVILGEVGLGGEVRKIYKLEQRLNEAKKLGFAKAVIPAGEVKSGLALSKIANVGELVKYVTS